MSAYQPKTGARCSCKRGVQRDNCPSCEGTGMMIDFAAIHARRAARCNDQAVAYSPIGFRRCGYHLTREGREGFADLDPSERSGARCDEPLTA